MDGLGVTGLQSAAFVLLFLLDLGEAFLVGGLKGELALF